MGGGGRSPRAPAPCSLNAPRKPGACFSLLIPPPPLGLIHWLSATPDLGELLLPSVHPAAQGRTLDSGDLKRVSRWQKTCVCCSPGQRLGWGPRQGSSVCPGGQVSHRTPPPLANTAATAEQTDWGDGEVRTRMGGRGKERGDPGRLGLVGSSLLVGVIKWHRQKTASWLRGQRPTRRTSSRGRRPAGQRWPRGDQHLRHLQRRGAPGARSSSVSTGGFGVRQPGGTKAPSPWPTGATRCCTEASACPSLSP